MLEIVLLLAILAATMLAICWLIVVFLDLTLAQGRLLPTFVACAAALLTALLVAHFSVTVPPSVRFVVIPLIVAAFAALLSCRRRDWELLKERPVTQRVESRAMRVAMILVACLTGYVLSLTSVGRVVLNALGQDVIGTLPREIIEIRIAGAIVGFLGGAFGTLFVWKACEVWCSRIVK